MSSINLVLRSRPKVGVSKDGHRRGRASGHPSRRPREEHGLLTMRSVGAGSSTRSARLSFQPLGGVLDDAEVSKFVDVEARLDETEIAGEIDIALQRREIGHHVRVAIIVLVGENPTEPLSRLLGDPRAYFHRFL